MEQPPPRSTEPASLRGVLLDERYRLEQVRDSHAGPDGRRVTLWRAIDISLDRKAAVIVVEASTKKARKAVTDAATRASRVADARCVRVLDVGELDAEPGVEACAWIATEWVEGPSLAALARRAPLDIDTAVEVARQCTEAMAVAARAGCHHGRLHPDEVLLSAEGLPRITGIETAAALNGTDADEAADVRGLGALLYAALTGRWPLPGWHGLPAVDGRQPPGPRSLRGGVPREVDTLVMGALSGRIASIDALLRALRALPARPVETAAPPPRRQAALRRWAWRLVPPMLVAVIAAGAWTIGSDLGRVPESARVRHPVLPPASATPGASRLALVWRTPPSVTSFDPEGDGQENQDSTGFAVDRDPSTTWTTDLYKHNSHLGGLKSGVGLLLDLGRPTTVQVAELTLAGVGSDVELRAGDRPPARADDLRLVATKSAAGTSVSWTLRPQVTARFWLIWFTNLPKAPGGYRGGITELALLGPTTG